LDCGDLRPTRTDCGRTPPRLALFPSPSPIALTYPAQAAAAQLEQLPERKDTAHRRLHSRRRLLNRRLLSHIDRRCRFTQTGRNLLVCHFI